MYSSSQLSVDISLGRWATENGNPYICFSGYSLLFTGVPECHLILAMSGSLEPCRSLGLRSDRWSVESWIYHTYYGLWESHFTSVSLGLLILTWESCKHPLLLTMHSPRVPCLTRAGMNSSPNSKAKNHEDYQDPKRLTERGSLRFGIERKARHWYKGEGLLVSRRDDSSLSFVGALEPQT